MGAALDVQHLAVVVLSVERFRRHRRDRSAGKRHEVPRTVHHRPGRAALQRDGRRNTAEVRLVREARDCERRACAERQVERTTALDALDALRKVQRKPARARLGHKACQPAVQIDAGKLALRRLRRMALDTEFAKSDGGVVRARTEFGRVLRRIVQRDGSVQARPARPARRRTAEGQPPGSAFVQYTLRRENFGIDHNVPRAAEERHVEIVIKADGAGQHRGRSPSVVDVVGILRNAVAVVVEPHRDVIAVEVDGSAAPIRSEVTTGILCNIGRGYLQKNVLPYADPVGGVPAEISRRQRERRSRECHLTYAARVAAGTIKDKGIASVDAFVG